MMTRFLLMKIRILVRSIMSFIETVVLVPVYVVAMLLLWIVVIPLGAVVAMVRRRCPPLTPPVGGGMRALAPLLQEGMGEVT